MLKESIFAITILRLMLNDSGKTQKWTQDDIWNRETARS